MFFKWELATRKLVAHTAKLNAGTDSFENYPINKSFV